MISIHIRTSRSTLKPKGPFEGYSDTSCTCIYRIARRPTSLLRAPRLPLMPPDMHHLRQNPLDHLPPSLRVLLLDEDLSRLLLREDDVIAAQHLRAPPVATYALHAREVARQETCDRGRVLDGGAAQPEILQLVLDSVEGSRFELETLRRNYRVVTTILFMRLRYFWGLLDCSGHPCNTLCATEQRRYFSVCG